MCDAVSGLPKFIREAFLLLLLLLPLLGLLLMQ